MADMDIPTWKPARVQGYDGLHLAAQLIHGEGLVDFEVSVVPGLGGRIASIKVAGEELLFPPLGALMAPRNFAGVEDLAAEKRARGFRLSGGDKTWIAPQHAWIEGIPPLELDAGSYSYGVHQNVVAMTSRNCRETGLRLTRTVQVYFGELQVEQTILNISDQPVQRGIWNVTQLQGSWQVRLPADPGTIRPYPEEGDSVRLQAHVLRDEDGWIVVDCNSQRCFKFGGPLREGRVIAEHETDRGLLIHERHFEIDASAAYAHDSMVEVYNSGDHDYCEVEIHAPLVMLQPGESQTHTLTWTFEYR